MLAGIKMLPANPAGNNCSNPGTIVATAEMGICPPCFAQAGWRAFRATTLGEAQTVIQDDFSSDSGVWAPEVTNDHARFRLLDGLLSYVLIGPPTNGGNTVLPQQATLSYSEPWLAQVDVITPEITGAWGAWQLAMFAQSEGNPGDAVYLQLFADTDQRQILANAFEARTAWEVDGRRGTTS